MLDKQRLIDRMQELEEGTKGLQSLIARAKHEITQAEANLFANSGAIQQLGLLIKEIEDAEKVVDFPKDKEAAE